MRTQFICLALGIVLICPIAPAQWVQTNLYNVGPVRCIAVSGPEIFAGTDGSGVFLSINNGENWTAVDSGLTSLHIFALAVSGTNVFAATADGVFLSTDNGTRWNAVNNGLTDLHVYALVVSGTHLFAGTGPLYPNSGTDAGQGVFLSTNNAASWTKVNTGLTDTSVYAFAVNPNGAGGTNLFTATNGGVFLSTNNGASWTEVSTGLDYVRALAVSPNEASGTTLFAGTLVDGLFLSSNNGTSWTQANSGSGRGSSFSAFAVSGLNLFAGTCYYVKAGPPVGVLVSTISGTSWTEVNAGLPRFKYDTTMISSIFSLAPSGQHLFAGTEAGVCRRPLSEMITSVEPVNRELPQEFFLKQNYPNPFNPSTTIKYELPKTSHVTLKVYDVLGGEVSVLVNDRREAGVHEVKFDGSNLASGMYFYRLQAGDFVESRKLLILK